MEDGRHTSSPTDDVPISRSSPSTNGDADESEPSGTVCPKDSLRFPDGSFVSREIDDGCNFASCPDRAHAGAGHFFPVWGSGGNIVCVDDTSPPSWSQIAAKHTPCCELASVFRPDVLLIHTKLAFLSSKCRHKSFTNSIYSYKSYNINVNDRHTISMGIVT